MVPIRPLIWCNLFPLHDNLSGDLLILCLLSCLPSDIRGTASLGFAPFGFDPYWMFPVRCCLISDSSSSPPRNTATQRNLMGHRIDVRPHVKHTRKVSIQLVDRLRQNADSGNNRPKSTGGKIISLTPQQKYSHRPGVHRPTQPVISNHVLPSPLLGMPKRKWVAEIQSKTTLMESITQ